MEQKFTTMAQEVIGDAIQSASAAGNAQVETLHVMDALLRQENGVIQGLIQAAGGNPQAIGAAVRNALVKMPAASGSTTSQPQASRQLTAALAQAEKEMQQMGDEYVSTEHLLIGIAASAPNQSADILKANGVTAVALRKAVPGVRGGAKVTSPDAEGSYKALEKYSTDLTARAKEGKLDPVIGRDQEIRRVIQILSRRTKNNPVLIGEPGVGKTAVVASSRSASRACSTKSRTPTARSSRSSTRFIRSSALARPKARWMPATCSSPCWRAASFA